MILKSPSFIRISIVCLLLSLLTSAYAADGPEQPIPDLTKGEELTRKNENWAGPIGVEFGFWRPRQRSNEQIWVRQLLVQKIEKGSPADGILEVGDVILGADGTGAREVALFQGAHKTLIPLANAITEAEARNPALLKLLVWREGATKTLTIELEYLGRYSGTAPYDCGKSKRILRAGIQALYEANEPDKAGFGILCLLAADDPTNPDNDKYQSRVRDWAHGLEVGGGPWLSGPKLMALSEYYMKTGDEAIFPKLVQQAEHHANGVSWFGTTGHRWAEKRPDGSGNGRIGGYGPINCSGTLGFLGLSLAREAGVESPAVEKAHQAQRIFFGHYAYKSGMPYGEHAYSIGGNYEDYNGKSAMSALAFALQDGEVEKAKYFSRRATLSSDSLRTYAHGGPFFGQVFHPLGANLGGKQAANMQFEEIRWHLDLKRSWDHSRIFDANSNPYQDFSYHATALLFYALPLQQIYLTGRGQKASLKFSDAEFNELVAVKNFDPAKATNKELVTALTRYQGLLRGPAGDELARRVYESPDAPQWPGIIDGLMAMASDCGLGLPGRTGACYTLMKIKNRSRDPVASMKNAEIAKTMVALLKDPDAYMCFAAVKVLHELDPSVVRVHVDAIMEAIVATERPTFPLNEEDPLHWAHGEMGKLLAEHVLKGGIEGVDRPKLIAAIRSLLQTPAGAYRKASTGLLSKLNSEETRAVSDLLLDNIETPPPADSMFGRGVGPACQAALAEHRFEEAVLLSMGHQPERAIGKKIPHQFGKAALEIRSKREVMQAVGDLLLVQAVPAQDLLDAFMEGEAPGELLKLKQIDAVNAADSVLKLPDAQTKLKVDATNFGVRTESGTTYTWRKLFGPGRVSFSPNESMQSKDTTVVFLDKKPGEYRFEVEMADSLGLSVVRETVGVTLYDARGQLPVNRPPYAKSSSFELSPGQPVSVELSGSDPDGDDLGFVVTEQPKHGRLTNANGRVIENLSAINEPLIYRANFGFTGKDRFTFMTLDGRGKAATGTIDFEVSKREVGVAVYEGFNYAAGFIHGCEGGSSFGFAGPWENSNGPDDGCKVEQARLELTGGSSLNYSSLPATGGHLTGNRWRSSTRPLDRKVLERHKLLHDGGELWFSIMMQEPPVRLELKGPDISLGFEAQNNNQEIHATLNGEKAGEARNPWSRSLNLRFKESAPHMIVGHCTWGKSDQDLDKLEIHRVFNAPVYGPILLENPVAVLEEAIDQQALDSLQIYTDFKLAIDEIRIGNTLSSVMLGTKPLD